MCRIAPDTLVRYQDPDRLQSSQYEENSDNLWRDFLTTLLQTKEPTNMATPLSEDTIANRLRAEFVDEAHDIVNEIDVMVGNMRSHSMARPTALSEMRRHFHNLRVGSRSVNLPAVELIVHRLDDYVSDLSDLTDTQIDDLQAFNDKLRAAIDGDTEAAATQELAQMVRELPARKTFDINDITFLNIEVMLVSPQRATARFVERELQACGYRVVNVSKSFEALEMAVRTKPDLIICSAVLDELSGIDLACAFNAMPVTHKIPFALLTSFTWGHPSLEGLPPRCAIIRKGPQFSDDLAEALSRFAIT